jgi:hypothetical protein
MKTVSAIKMISTPISRLVDARSTVTALHRSFSHNKARHARSPSDNPAWWVLARSRAVAHACSSSKGATRNLNSAVGVIAIASRDSGMQPGQHLRQNYRIIA